MKPETADLIERLRTLVDSLEDALERHQDKPSRIEKELKAISDILEYF